MMYDSFARAFVNEIKIFSPTIQGLNHLGYKPCDILKYLAGRYFSAEAERSGEQFSTRHGFDLVRRRDYVLYQEIFILDTYRTAIWGKELAKQQAPIVMDMGSNVGMFSALCATICPTVQLSCFDIMPECGTATTRKLSSMQTNPRHVVIAALGARHGGEIVIHYDHPYDAANNVDNAHGAKMVSVPCISLDRWRQEVGMDEPVYLAKIDVEGAECDVVRGAMATLGATEYILMELHGTMDALKLLDPTHVVVSCDQTTIGAWVCVLRRRHHDKGA